MEHDEDFPKFFVYLNLFVASMLLLVLADNFLLSFLGWEGVGLCSYLLIAFWFERNTAASAGKKAMIFNRIGDFGFLVAMFLIFERTGSLELPRRLRPSRQRRADDLIGRDRAAAVPRRGRQVRPDPALPLAPRRDGGPDAGLGADPRRDDGHRRRLPDVPDQPVLHWRPTPAHVIASVGAATALLGATIACAQNDIKKVLAYSTISQLGYMFLAAGVGAYVAAIFLMLTHAFYKALLVPRRRLGHPRDERRPGHEDDGRSARFMPITAVHVHHRLARDRRRAPVRGLLGEGRRARERLYVYSPALWAVGALTAVLTAYYMGREYLLVFCGRAAVDRRRGGPATSATTPMTLAWVMSLPLVVLGALLGRSAGSSTCRSIRHLVFLDRWLEPGVRRAFARASLDHRGLMGLRR